MMLIAYILMLGLAVSCTNAITPEQLLAAPRRSVPILNPAGTFGVFSSTTYNWTTHKSSKSWNIIDISSGNISLAPKSFTTAVSEFVFVGDTLLYLNSTVDTASGEVDGGVGLWIGELTPGKFISTQIGHLPAPYSGLKAVRTEAGAISFLVYSLADQTSGKAYNPEVVTAPLSSARLYDNVFIRHWDFNIEKERNAIFSGSITLSPGGGYSFDNNVKNLLFRWADQGVITLPESPIPPFGDAGDYDLSPDGSTVAFITKAPELSKANYTASYVYLVPHDGSTLPVKLNGPDTTASKDARGASSTPVWSPDGKKVAFGQMDGVTYESDRNKLYIYDVESKKITNLLSTWDYSVGSIVWNPHSKSLYLGNDFKGANRLFVVPLDSQSDFEPIALTGIESISGLTVLPDGNVFVAATAIWTSAFWYTLDVRTKRPQHVIFSANEVDSELAGLTSDGVRDFWYDGYEGDRQHSWIVLPTAFDESKKYPVIFLVHGGPQGFSGNSWSSRWNLRTWADQGYILVAPNPTGSTSYGQALTDRIQEQWGGRPYQDLLNAWEHVKENLPYADTSNSVAAGASYGCYMMNWIQGHDLGREFKALVCHDGKISTLTNYVTDELWFIEHDNNGTIWNDEKPSQDPEDGYTDDVAFVGTNPNYSRWSPSRFAANFATPQFIIHSERDYRVPISEGIFTFNVLQSKGIPSRFLTFPDETHWVVNRENSLVWHTEIFNWINYWTGKTPTLDSSRVIRQ